MLCGDWETKRPRFVLVEKAFNSKAEMRRES